MNLGKKSALFGTVVFLILALLLNLVIFAIFNPSTFESDALRKVFWFSYAFMMVAFVLQIVSIIVGRPKEGFEMVFFGIPLLNVSLFYFVITTVLSLTFMILSNISVSVPFTLVFVLEILVLGLYLVAFVVTLYHKTLVIDRNKEIKAKVGNIKDLLTDVEILAESAEDKELKKKLDSLAEDIKYSDPMSNEAISIIDEQIRDGVAELSIYVTDGDIANATAKIQAVRLLITKRNKKLLVNK